MMSKFLLSRSARVGKDAQEEKDAEMEDEGIVSLKRKRTQIQDENQPPVKILRKTTHRCVLSYYQAYAHSVS